MRNLIRFLYSSITFKRELFILLRKFTRLPEKIYKHFHFKGIISVEVDKEHNFKMYHLGEAEENELFWGGIDNGWEKTSLKLWRKLCLDSKTVIDIGANTGLYSLVTKSLNPKANIYAFEPLPKVLEYLNYNVLINKYNIKVTPKALSNYNGFAKVYLLKDKHFSNSVTVNKSLLSDSTPQMEIEIETMRFDDFIQENKINSIDLVKIDVETHEPEVLEGMGKYLDAFLPDFLIEVLNQDCASQLNIIFKDKGYLYFDIDDKNDIVTLKQQIEPSSFWNYLVCKPETAKKIGLI